MNNNGGAIDQTVEQSPSDLILLAQLPEPGTERPRSFLLPQLGLDMAGAAVSKSFMFFRFS